MAEAQYFVPKRSGVQYDGTNSAQILAMLGTCEVNSVVYAPTIVSETGGVLTIDYTDPNDHAVYVFNETDWLWVTPGSHPRYGDMTTDADVTANYAPLANP